jgi:hypothetical protein
MRPSNWSTATASRAIALPLWGPRVVFQPVLRASGFGAGNTAYAGDKVAQKRFTRTGLLASPQATAVWSRALVDSGPSPMSAGAESLALLSGKEDTAIFGVRNITSSSLLHFIQRWRRKATGWEFGFSEAYRFMVAGLQASCSAAASQRRRLIHWFAAPGI